MGHLNLPKRIHGYSSITLQSVNDDISKTQNKSSISIGWIDFNILPRSNAFTIIEHDNGMKEITE